MEDWGDFTLNITVMPPEPAADEELVPTKPFLKPTLAQLQPRPSQKSEPLPLRAGTLHSVAGLPLPPTGPRPLPVTPPPRATLDSLRATTDSRPIRTTGSSATGSTPRPSSRITPAFGTRLTPPSGSRLRPAVNRRSRWARDLLQRFNFDDCA